VLGEEERGRNLAVVEAHGSLGRKLSCWRSVSAASCTACGH